MVYHYVNYNEKGSKHPIAMEYESHRMLYLHKRKDEDSDSEPDLFPKNVYDFNIRDYERILKEAGVKGKKRELLLMDFENQYFNNTQTVNSQYSDIYKQVAENESKKFKAHQKLIPVLRKDWFDVVLIQGKSGAGKTKSLIRMVNAYKMQLNKKEKPDIYLISKKESDDMIDNGKAGSKNKLDRGLKQQGMERIDVETFLEKPMVASEIPDKSIIIFDDFEGYQNNKKLFALIIGFLNDLATMGRTKLVKIFIITHQSTFGKDSSVMFIELSWYVCCPFKTPPASLDYVLERKIGISKEARKRVEKLNRIFVDKNSTMCLHGKYCEYLQS